MENGNTTVDPTENINLDVDSKISSNQLAVQNPHTLKPELPCVEDGIIPIYLMSSAAYAFFALLFFLVMRKNSEIPAYSMFGCSLLALSLASMYAYKRGPEFFKRTTPVPQFNPTASVRDASSRRPSERPSERSSEGSSRPLLPASTI